MVSAVRTRCHMSIQSCRLVRRGLPVQTRGHDIAPRSAVWVHGLSFGIGSCATDMVARRSLLVPAGSRTVAAHMDDLTRLLLDARDGDRSALHAVVMQTQTDVWRFCAHLVDPASADDLTQDVYVRLMRTIGNFRGDASARTWILTITRRTCIDEVRRRARWRLRVDNASAVPEEPDEDRAPSVAIAGELETLLHDVDIDRRAAFVLTQLIGLSYREAAATEGVPVGTIRSRVARARRQLIDAFAADQDLAHFG